VPTFALVAQGEMGAGLARRLTDNGAVVLTRLEGRSQASRARAKAAGMRAAGWGEMREAEIFLSVVPPSFALDLARQAADSWRGAERAPLYVDCNAVSPRTAIEIAQVVADAGMDFVDAGVIGGPPRAGGAGPRLYACGVRAPDFAALQSFGLDVRDLSAPIGAASALKMSYAGITKGMTAIGAVMILAAMRTQAGAALKSELAISQPERLAWLERQIQGMFPKAYRWVGEMEEIAAFVGDEFAGAEAFSAIARFYERIASHEGGEGGPAAAVHAFFSTGGDSAE
jgi:putative dehydrogenase